MAGINLKQDSNEFKIRMVQDTGQGDREDKKDSACTDHFTGALDTKYMCKDDLDVESTISSADVKGVLEALNFWMGFLAEGE